MFLDFQDFLPGKASESRYPILKNANRVQIFSKFGKSSKGDFCQAIEILAKLTISKFSMFCCILIWIVNHFLDWTGGHVVTRLFQEKRSKVKILGR